MWSFVVDIIRALPPLFGQGISLVDRKIGTLTESYRLLPKKGSVFIPTQQCAWFFCLQKKKIIKRIYNFNTYMIKKLPYSLKKEKVNWCDMMQGTPSPPPQEAWWNQSKTIFEYAWIIQTAIYCWVISSLYTEVFFRLFSKDHNKAMNYALYIHIPLCQIRKGKYQSADWVVSTE